jgi:hypothetical protein
MIFGPTIPKMKLSWSGLSRPSTIFTSSIVDKSWMPGIRPGMTTGKVPLAGTITDRATFLSKSKEVPP